MIEATVKREYSHETKAFPVWLGFLLTAIVALATRLPYYRDLVVPLNDGGMFAQIVDDIRANGMRLPSHTTYNFLNLPVSYPPVAFLLAAVVGEITHLSTLDVLKGMPLFFNLASVMAFCALSLRLSSSRSVWISSSLLFGLLPQASGWLVMGGGLTRSPGFFFSLITFLCAHEALTKGNRLSVMGVGVFAALAGLSHLESGTLVVFVLPLFALYFGPWKKSVVRLLPAAAISLAITLPWLAWLQGNVGFDPLRFASRTSMGKTPLESGFEWLCGLMLTDRFSMLAVLLAPTAIWLVVKRRWLLPAWCGVAMVLVSRSAYTQVSVPVAMLAAEGWVALWRWRSSSVRPWWEFSSWAAIGVVLATWTAIDKYIFGYPLPAIKFDALASLSRDELAAMRWCRENTPKDAHFVVVSERMDQWYVDMVGEWFPYLAQRHSILTVQGREWRPNDEFRRWQELLEQASEAHRVSGFDEVVRASGETYDYAFVSGPLLPPRSLLAKGMAKSKDFRLLHTQGEVRVYQRAKTSKRTAVRRSPSVRRCS